jgi:iron(III) transport system substrate-binding protein
MKKFAPIPWAHLFAAIAMALTFAKAGEASWQPEWEKTLSAAEKEGMVTIYGQVRHPVSAAIQAFTKFYPKITLNFIGGPGGELGHRIMAEKRAGKHLVDIAIGGSGTQVEIYYKAGLLEPLRAAFILPEVRDETAWWGKKHLYADPDRQHVFIMEGSVTTRMGAYNSELVKAGEIKSWWDLLDPKWKGKIVMTSPKVSGNIQSWVFIYVSPDLGPKFLSKLLREMEVAFSASERQMMDWLATGKYPIHLMAKPDNVQKAKEQALPVELLYSEKEAGSLSSGSGHISFFKDAPHPNAAKVYVNWILSKEGQLMWQKIAGDNSLRMDIPKTMVNEREVPRAGKQYIISSQHLDAVKPVRKLINELLP